MSRIWDLSGRAIAITGGSSGIGAATAEACARAGMDVAVGARRVDRLRQTVERVESCGRRGLAVACDVTSDRDVQGLIDATYARFGRLDAVFCNAGLTEVCGVLDTTDERMRYLFEVNYYGTLRAIRAAVPAIRKTADASGLADHDGDASSAGTPSNIRGQVIICSSVVSEIGLPFHGAYCATKAAQDAIASSLRAELASEQIWVSSVHPIGTRTELLDHLGPDAARNTHRWFIQTPETVAAAIVKGMRYPKAEIWPHWPTRLGVAGCTAIPGLAAKVLKKMAKGRDGRT